MTWRSRCQVLWLDNLDWMKGTDHGWEARGRGIERTMRMPPWNKTRPWIRASTASRSYTLRQHLTKSWWGNFFLTGCHLVVYFLCINNRKLQTCIQKNKRHAKRKEKEKSPDDWMARQAILCGASWMWSSQKRLCFSDHLHDLLWYINVLWHVDCNLNLLNKQA